jgi:hypothetical protein
MASSAGARQWGQHSTELQSLHEVDTFKNMRSAICRRHHHAHLHSLTGWGSERMSV